MATDITPAKVREYFLRMNKTLTMSLIIALVIASALFWYTGLATIQDSSFWIGLAFMLLAVLFSQIPHISFLLTQHHFSGQKNQVEVLNLSWKGFKNWLES